MPDRELKASAFTFVDVIRNETENFGDKDDGVDVYSCLMKQELFLSSPLSRVLLPIISLHWLLNFFRRRKNLHQSWARPLSMGLAYIHNLSLTWPFIARWYGEMAGSHGNSDL